MAEFKTKMLDDWIQQKCTRCKHFKKREGKQRLDRCTNDVQDKLDNYISEWNEYETKDSDNNDFYF